MNLISLTVGAGIMGILMPGVMTMSIAPMVASVRSNNFSAAEAKAVAYAAKANVSYDEPALPQNCNFDDSLKPTEVICHEGEGKYKMIAKRSFLLLNTGQRLLAVYSDDDLDGFDDITGLPTHAWACYSGWTNQDTLKNNCELGGSYVISAYAHLYD